MARRRVFFFLFALALTAAASAASALSIAASRQPTPTATAGTTPTPEPRKGESLQQQQQQQQQQPLPARKSSHGGSSSSPSCRAAAAKNVSSLPLFASAPAWQRSMRPKLKILAVPLVSGRSNLFVMHAVAAELAARGHEVKASEEDFDFFFEEKNRSRARRDTLCFWPFLSLSLPAFSLPFL